MTRIVIFTGKGGVGKTTVAAAHAWQSAQMGSQTLLVSTDMAHNLGDLFERRVGREETEIIPGLTALELDPEYIMQQEFGDLLQALGRMMGTREASEEIRIPGMENLFALLKLLALYESGRYEHIIVDCAPTGETLALLKLPELLSWYMERFFPLGKLAVRVLSPLSKKVFQMELPDKNAMNDIERLYSRLLALQSVLKDAQVTSIRLVTLAEKMVVAETKRSYMYLNLYGYQVDGLYINRVLPQDMAEPFFAQWLAIQETYIKELTAVFGHLPIVRLPWYETDICGQESLQRLTAEVLGSDDQFCVRSRVEHERYLPVEDGYLLILYLPLVQKEELEVYQSAADLIVRIGNFKRSIPLPNSLRHAEIVSARLTDQTLKVHLRKEVPHET